MLNLNTLVNQIGQLGPVDSLLFNRLNETERMDFVLHFGAKW